MRKRKVPAQDRFVDPDLKLAVIEAMLRQGLMVTTLRVPALEPEDDDDLEEESESWRDHINEDEIRVVSELHALLATHADRIAAIEEIDDFFMEVYEDPEQFAEIDSLAGIEQCSGLRRLTFTTGNKKLDLTPLTALPLLEAIDLGSSRIRDVSLLLALPKLRSVKGRIDARTAAALRERGVEVTLTLD